MRDTNNRRTHASISELQGLLAITDTHRFRVCGYLGSRYEASKVDSLKPRKYIHLGALTAQIPTGTKVISGEKTWRNRNHVLEKGKSCSFLAMACSSTLSRRAWVQGYLARKKTPPPWDHHRSLCIGIL